MVEDPDVPDDEAVEVDGSGIEPFSPDDKYIVFDENEDDDE